MVESIYSFLLGDFRFRGVGNGLGFVFERDRCYFGMSGYGWGGVFILRGVSGFMIFSYVVRVYF